MKVKNEIAQEQCEKTADLSVLKTCSYSSYMTIGITPTQDFMGLHFGLTQPKVAVWIKVLDPLFLQSLDKLKLIPVRNSDDLDDRLIESVTVTVLLDGSERPINRPKYEQQEYFSGKKTNTR